MVISHNMQALNTKDSLKVAGKEKASGMEKLSSGYKIGCAADNAAGLAISEKMRHQIRGLDRSSRNIQEGMDLTKNADGGLNEVHSIMQRQRELMVQAANDTNTKEDRQAIEMEIKTLTDELDRIYEDTEFNTIKLFKGHDELIPAPVVYPDGSKTLDPNPFNTTIGGMSTTLIGPNLEYGNKYREFVLREDYGDSTKDKAMMVYPPVTEVKEKDNSNLLQNFANITYNGGSTTPTVIWPQDPAPVGKWIKNENDDPRLRSHSYGYSSKYQESENVIDTDELGHNVFEKEENYKERSREYISHTQVSVTYSHLEESEYDAYTHLRDPKDMVGQNGYINVVNEASTLSLSCAMSQLGLEVDGNVISCDLFKYPCTKEMISGSDASGNAYAKNTFEIPDYNIKVVQTITRKSTNPGGTPIKDEDNQYDISYSIINNDSNPHAVNLRLAFDTLNVKAPYTKTTTDVPSDYVLENDDAKVTIESNGTKSSVLTDISDLYDVMDDSKVNPAKSGISHSGFGAWWEAPAVAAGSETELGDVKYTILLKRIPINVEEKRETYVEKITADVDSTTITAYKPEYLDIQAGPKGLQNIPIRLWDLSTSNLRYEVPHNVSAFNADDSLVHIDRALQKMSDIRSYYGALYNRMDHAYRSNDNTSENIQASESKIRDTDMASEIVRLSKNSILEQAGQSMLAQANSMKQTVLQLLQ